MKPKELNSLRTKTGEELQEMVDKKQTEILQQKMKMGVSKGKNLKQVKILKKEVSQILTLINEKKFTQEEIDDKKEKESGV